MYTQGAEFQMTRVNSLSLVESLGMRDFSKGNMSASGSSVFLGHGHSFHVAWTPSMK